MDLFVLVLGLGGLWFGTDLALDGALSLSKRMGVSEGFVGLTVLAIGTGLPELVVGLDGGIQQLKGLDASGVVVGNAVGSAISQGALVLGVAGVIAYLRMSRRIIRRDAVTLLFAAGLLLLLALDGIITRVEGAVLMLAYAVYFTALIQSERARINGDRPPAPATDEHPIDAAWKVILSIVGGLGLVVFSAELVVERAVILAEVWGVSQVLLGIFLVGLGTSLPELALSVRAALRGNASISVGNVIGSNTFDLLVPVGASAAIFPLAVGRETVTIDIPMVALITVATMYFFTRKKGLQRGEAILLLGIYAAYVAVRILAV